MVPSDLMMTLGALFLGALALDALGRRIHVPRVTLLILLGAALGPPGLDALPNVLGAGGDGFTAVALTMVAFLLGGALEHRRLRTHGRAILMLSVSVTLASVAVVALALLAVGAPLVVALAMAGISAATDPAATHDVVRQSGRQGRFATNLLGIVAIDDAWGLIAFSLLITVAGLASGGEAAGEAVLHGLREAGGGIALGAAIGLPAAYLTGRLKRGEPSLLEALGIVLICAGASLHFGVSYLLAGMTAGAIVVNLARHHSRPFHEIERIEWPFVLLFFIMAGGMLDPQALGGLGWLGLAYIAARLAARMLGGWAGARLAGTSRHEGFMTGIALTPQAGVAIGMALVTAERFPQHGEQIVVLTVASTIVFELAGPFLTQFALSRVPDEA